MIMLQFNVQKQFINRTDTYNPTADSKHYLFAHFNFNSEEWQDKVVTAIFTKDGTSHYKLIDVEGYCEVPWEVINPGDFFVSVFTGDLITTNKSRVNVGETGYTEDAENSEAPTPNIYNQLTTQFGDLRSEVDNRLNNIDGGLFTDWRDE